MSDADKTHQTIVDVWNEYEDEERREDISHWRGKGRWKDDEKWQRIGRSTLRDVRFIHRAFGKPPLPPSNPSSAAKANPFKGWLGLGRTKAVTVLEWGPGGGSNVFAFRHSAKRYYGVDISKRNLDECVRMISEAGHKSLFQPVLVGGSPDSAVSLVTEPIDVVVSTAVFQHFPSKEYGADVLRAMRRTCKKDAVGIIQIRFDNGKENFRPITDISEYYKKHITANSYGLDEFWMLLQQCGFQPLMIRNINPKVNYATFFFRVAG